jgi:tRNA A58 N-methylase Trm61
VAKEWYDKDWDLPPEMAFLAGHGLDQGALVFDLGAHQCLIAMMLAKQVGPQGHVVAVEANRHNVSVARRNVALNRVDNVTVTHAMISNRAGRERA